MKKGLVINDTHFRGEIFHYQLQSLDNVVQEVQPDYILHGGDLFNRGDVGDMKMAPPTMIKLFTDYVTQLDIPWIIAAGNHDYVNDVCALDFLHHPLVTVVKEPKILQLEDVEPLFMVLPWVHGGTLAVRKYFESRKKLKRPLVIVGHADLQGFNFEGRELTAAHSAYCLNPTWWEPLQPVAWWFGHIHHQDLRDNERGGYLGSVFPKDFGESSNPGHVGILTGGTGVDTFPVGHAVLRYHDLTEVDPVKINRVLRRMTEARNSPVFFVKVPEGVELDENPKFKVTRKRAGAVTVSQTRIKGDADLTETFRQYAADQGIEPTDALLAAWERYRPLVQPVGQNSPAISSLSIRNIGCVQKRTIDFHEGLTALVGRTGTGKSTALEAIPLCLYNTLPDGRKVGKLTCSESYERISVVSTPELISRNWGNSGTKYSLDREAVTDTNFYHQTSQMFGAKNIFFACNFLSQKRSNDLVRAKPADRMLVLREIFGLDDFDNKHELIKAEFKKNAGQELLLKNVQEQISEKVRDYQSAKQSREALTTEIQMLQSKVNTLATINYDQLRSNMDTTAKKWRMLWSQEISQPILEYQSAKRHYQSALEKFQERASKAGCMKEDGSTLPCPLLQAPEKPVRPFWHRVIEDRELPEVLPKIDWTKSQPEHRQTWTRIVDAFNAAKAAKTKFSSDSVAAVQENQKIEKEIAALQGKLEYTVEKLGTLKTDLKKLRKQAEEIHEKIAHLKVLEVLGKALSPYGLVQWWLEAHLPEIQAQVNEVLQVCDFLHGMEIKFEFSNGKNPKLEIHVVDDKPARLIEDCSGGEATCVSLAVLLALSNGTMFLDEPFVGLDVESVAVVAKFLHQQAQKRQIIIVTHEPIMKNYADKVVEFV